MDSTLTELTAQQLKDFADEIGVDCDSLTLLFEMSARRVEDGMTPDEATMSAHFAIQNGLACMIEKSEQFAPLLGAEVWERINAQ
jgi:hypothetical protein